MKFLDKIFIISVLLTFSTALFSQQKTISINDDWQFVKGDLGGIWEAVRPVKKGKPETVPVWSNVVLPHCFNAYDAVDPDANYYQGPGWYRKYVEIESTGGKIFLHFEGVGQKAHVYIHQTQVGEHVGGYDEWRVDITDAVKQFRKSEFANNFQGKVPVVIRADNSRDLEMIPSDLSDFNIYGGIYRGLNLEYKPVNHIKNVSIEPVVNPGFKSGNLSINVQFTGEVESSGDLTIELTSPEGKKVLTKQTTIPTLFKDYTSESFKIKKPILWSPDTPALYTCKITLATKKGIHSIAQKVGFRNFEFVKQGPFKINGKRLLLRGTHRHEDHAGTGAAMTKSQIKKEMEMMKEMGVNFIRLGHYQQNDYVLDLCDALGILVWEEIPWCRGGLGGDIYKEQARRMLRNMIEQHRNHPSIIIWGLGNENDWPGDFTEFNKNKIRAFMGELNDLSHELDMSRKTAIRRCNFCKDIVDVYSPSIWAGWYRGKFTDYKKVSKLEMSEVNHFLHVEWGASNHAKRHSENPDKGIANVISGERADERDGDASLYAGGARVSKDGDWTETYACNLIDWHLKEQENMPWLTGTAYWPFKDFSTPVRPENPVPYVNQKGVVERDFTKKEAFYVFQSYWTKRPMIHIYGHSWPTRWGEKGEKKMIKVYSNCTEVELIVNGISQGIKKRNSQDYPAAGLRWEVSLDDGMNRIKAIGKKSKTTVIDDILVDYQIQKWSEPNALSLSVKSIENDIVWLEAKALDANGTQCLDAKNLVHFKAAGDGTLIVNQGTSSGSKKVQLYNGRALIGLSHNKGCTTVSVTSKGLKTAFKTFNSNAIDRVKSKDLFLILGQSNKGDREPLILPNSELKNISLFTKAGKWTDVSGPLNAESSIRKSLQNQKFGSAYSFAKTIAKNFSDRSIGLVVNIREETEIGAWKQGGHFFNESVKRIREAQKEGDLKAIIWYPRAVDLNNKNYPEELAKLISAYREALEQPELPFICWGILNAKGKETSTFNKHLEQLADNKANTYYVSKNKLTVTDDIQFDNELTFEEHYVEVIKDALYNKLSLTNFDAERILENLANKYKTLAENTKIHPKCIPRTINDDGTMHGVKSKDWTSGFYPGILWYLYEYSKYPELLAEAMEISTYIENQQFNGNTHDMGFKIGCSVGNGYWFTGNNHYKNVLIQSAETLITRYNPIVGCIRSWDHNTDKWDYPVIIDNMMNLELLLNVFKLTGNKKFYDIAVSHADMTMKNHFREDYSSYHVIGYNPETGKVEKKNTHQGYSHESAWARGQAWGLYGYTVMYRETKNIKYLEQAQKIAAFILNHQNLPEDLIPYWDYDVPNIIYEPRDASAAAVTASALIELSGYTMDKDTKKNYLNSSKTILKNLSSEHYKEDKNKYFVLDHSTGSKPYNSEIDVPLIYADYYYVEALLRLVKL
ncbi:sialate O-acetylesterase [Tamlana sp. 2201CG12-4]|uniref:sialate O-acetylesterase n=1 Tax=Tamlana sp. 2201CG12-4 TaxID=3112582 RepID=UPI002DBF4C97|nr:sialate O-acetylesterase [Tamlana sp. 2201CG12-4]MEC3907026.1 sialate O-acetylesterase [Tamlana sp. 2201CG12-4]